MKVNYLSQLGMAARIRPRPELIQWQWIKWQCGIELPLQVGRQRSGAGHLGCLHQKPGHARIAAPRSV